MQEIINYLGWIGSISLLLAYFLNSSKAIKANSLSYQLLNLIGGSCLVINTLFHSAYPSTFLNLVWAMIAGSYYVKIKNDQQLLKEKASQAEIE